MTRGRFLWHINSVSELMCHKNRPRVTITRHTISGELHPCNSLDIVVHAVVRTYQPDGTSKEGIRWKSGTAPQR